MYHIQNDDGTIVTVHHKLKEQEFFINDEYWEQEYKKMKKLYEETLMKNEELQKKINLMEYLEKFNTDVI